MNPFKKIISSDHLPVILTIIMVFILGLQKNYSPDVGFHLQSAKWILENGKIISQDQFTYTSFGNNYFDMQWLYQLVLYGFYKSGKDAAIIILNSALITLTFIILWMRYKKENLNKVNVSLFCILLIIGVQALPFEIRPHVFSWLYLSLVLLILENHKKGSAKKLFLLPVIMLLWVNSHSLSILGLVVIGIYSIGGYLETKKTDKQLIKFATISLTAFFINPYFIDGFLFPFSQLGIIKGDALQKSYVGELQSPFTLHELKQQGLGYLLNPLFYLQLYSIVAFVVCIKAFLQKRITEALLIAAFFIITYMAMKNYGYLLIVTLPIVAKYLQEFLERRKLKNKKTFKEGSNKRIRFAVIIIAVIISWLSITDGYSVMRQSPYHFGITVDKESVPVEATDFLNKNKIFGRLLNHLDFGGYMMYNYPEKVFIDGRIELPKPDFFKKYFKSLKPGGFESLLNEYDPEIIIFPYTKATGWWSYLISNKNYRPVYFDGLASIYLKNGKFENIAEIKQEIIQTNSNEEINNVILEEKPSRSIAVMESFFRKQYFPIDEQNKATFCFTYGLNDAALEYSAIGIKKATVNPKNIFYNLNLYFKGIKKYREADICFKRSK